LGEMARFMRRNPSYLSALFSQTTGVPFHQYLEEVRLSKARELLRDPRNRVSEVAQAVGYASSDAFRHAFRSREGLSPTAWRGGAVDLALHLPQNSKNLSAFPKSYPLRSYLIGAAMIAMFRRAKVHLANAAPGSLCCVETTPACRGLQCMHARRRAQGHNAKEQTSASK
jgi:AraC-like DNA-binding protein